MGASVAFGKPVQDELFELAIAEGDSFVTGTIVLDTFEEDEIMDIVQSMGSMAIEPRDLPALPLGAWGE